jgi:hypothetical protein
MNEAPWLGRRNGDVRHPKSGRVSHVLSGLRLAFVAILALTGGERGVTPAFAAELSRIGESGKLCISPADGLEKTSADNPRLYVRWGRPFGVNCSGGSGAFKLGVTQESMQNSHTGSRNYDPNVAAYMADFDFDKDFGRWLSAAVNREGDEPVVSLRLDTIDFDEVNTITGWPLRQGHLFVGLNDGTVSFSLDRDAVVEFDMRVSTAAVSNAANPTYSGRRIMVGALARWTEAPPRANTAHFLETDLMISDGYSRMYNEKRRPDCDDADYDRCFYDENGRYAEGREVSFQKTLHGPELGRDPAVWTHVRIPIGATYRDLAWVSKPASWAKAKVGGMYIAIESVGATNTEIEIENYHVRNMP